MRRNRLRSSSSRRARMLAPVGLLGGAAAALFLVLYTVDWAWTRPGTGLWETLLHFDPETLQGSVSNLAATIAAVLGIVITVVSIVVQLASTRYTPRIANLFLRDRTNVSVIAFFIVACIHAVWVSVALGRSFAPRLSIVVSVVLVTLSLLAIGPYFAYVFDFLDPEKIIRRIQKDALDTILSSASAPETGAAATASLASGDRQQRALDGIERLSDIAVSAISQKDKAIAQGALDALGNLAGSYLEHKASLPSEWFAIGPALRGNPDFVSLAGDSVESLASGRVWLEWKILRQYQSVYREALAGMPDIAHVLAINTRYIGEAALGVRDLPTVELVVKFFNTYLRATLNASDVRTAYNVLHQYRQLADNALAQSQTGIVTKVAAHFRYYGTLAQSAGLPFVTETVAYDLAALCEAAWDRRAPSHDAILHMLLTLDRAAETKSEEKGLRGVRKAQMKLATFYLERGAEEIVQRVIRDLKDEERGRLLSICTELEGVDAQDFWEVVDRGTNFDYLTPSRRQRLAELRALL